MELEDRIRRARRMKKTLRGNAYERWQRRQLWEMNPECHWCKRRTILPPRYKGRHAPGEVNPLFATVDHLDSRLSGERGKHFGKFRRVLSCWKCNNDRGEAEMKAIPIQTRWERSLQIFSIAKRSGALNEVDGWAPE